LKDFLAEGFKFTSYSLKHSLLVYNFLIR